MTSKSARFGFVRVLLLLAAVFTSLLGRLLERRRPRSPAPWVGATESLAKSRVLFSPRADIVLRRAMVIFVLAAIGVPLLLMALVRTPVVTGEGSAPAQPMWFDHSHHVTGYRIDCRYCHMTVERTAAAGMPATETCVPCHAAVWLDGPYFAPVRRSLNTGRPIAWRRVYDLPDHVFFHHAAHTTGGIGCESCHGRVDRMSVVAQTVPLTMAWCLDCHSDPSPYVRPVAAVTVMGWKDGDRPLSTAERPRPRLNTRALLDCTICHR